MSYVSHLNVRKISSINFQGILLIGLGLISANSQQGSSFFDCSLITNVSCVLVCYLQQWHGKHLILTLVRPRQKNVKQIYRQP